MAHGGKPGKIMPTVFDLWYSGMLVHNEQNGGDLGDRLKRCFELAKNNPAHEWLTIEEMIVDLLDDVVDLYIDEFRKGVSNEEDTDVVAEGRGGTSQGG